jgi:hypothetical protein
MHVVISKKAKETMFVIRGLGLFFSSSPQPSSPINNCDLEFGVLLAPLNPFSVANSLDAL